MSQVRLAVLPYIHVNVFISISHSFSQFFSKVIMTNDESTSIKLRKFHLTLKLNKSESASTDNLRSFKNGSGQESTSLPPTPVVSTELPSSVIKVSDLRPYLYVISGVDQRWM